MSTSKLFQPIKVGDLDLQHRVVMAPLTLFRANAAHEHCQAAIEYYAQRAGIPGTFLFTKGTFSSPDLGGYPNVPGIWNPRQIAQWKKLWALGRVASPEVLEAEGPYPYISSGNVQMEGKPARPRPFTIAEIKGVVAKYATAAKNAVEGAGFDGVEIQAAGGYLIDQFFQSGINNLTDEYGGSLENRIRFANEVVDAVGPKKTGIRISPWIGKRMEDPMATFGDFVRCLRANHPDFAYLHVVEPRINGEDFQAVVSQTNEPLCQVWAPKPSIATGGFTREGAIKVADEKDILVRFGRPYISNPDLPLHLKAGHPLTKYNRTTFYTSGPDAIEGYTDYPFYSEAQA